MKEAGKKIGVLWQDFGFVHTDLLIKKLHHVVDVFSHLFHDQVNRLSDQDLSDQDSLL